MTTRPLTPPSTRVSFFSSLFTQWRDFSRHAVRALPRGKWLAGLLLVILTAALARVTAVFVQPMTHDESYTFIAFASQSLPNLLSDYHLPNNHILNSVLIHFSTDIFGNGPLAVRLPALLAGLLTVAAVYLLARAQYGDGPAMLAASITAFLQAQVDISILARGYSLLGLLVLLELLLAFYIRRHQNFWGWLFFALLGAAGFFTVPIMLYPIGVIGLWLALCAVFNQIGAGYKNRWRFLAWLAGTALLTGVITTILYLPAVLGTSLDALIDNPFVNPLSTEQFLSLLPNRIREIWHIWQEGIGLSIWLLVAGFLLSIIYAPRTITEKIPPQTGLLWIPLVAAVQHPNPWPKIFMYLLPMLILWGVGGWFELARWRFSQKTLNIAAAIMTAVVITLSIARDLPQALELPPVPGEVEQAAEAIVELYQPGDALLGASPNDAPLWIYAYMRDIPKSAFSHLEDRPIQRAFVMVNPVEGQTIETVLRERKLDPGNFDLDSAVSIFDICTTQVFLITADNP